MSKNELLERAKKLNIVGRHDMSKEDLETAVRQREMIQANVQAVKEEKAASEGKNLVKRTNLNLPWRRKFYFIDVRVYELKGEIIKKAPPQVQLILKAMVEADMTSAENSEMGGTIASMAIKGGLKTKIEPHVLFAYYRKEMERFGLTFAGYNMN